MMPYVAGVRQSDLTPSILLSSEIFSLTGKTAVVTGAASGIGLAIAELFAKQGAAVQIFDLNLEQASEAARSINAMGLSGSAAGFECNVADEASTNKAFAAVIAANGRVDILVNNAGIGHVGDLLSTEGEDMDRMYNVNVKGIFHCSKVHSCAHIRLISSSTFSFLFCSSQPAVASMLADEKGGVVLNLASIASLIGA
jgi:NAD(P)-dependent dehydrogenase (short-subunit alcohol dehydrogenase family)